MSVDDIVPRQHGDGEGHYVLRLAFVAPDLVTAERIAAVLVTPVLHGRAIDWEVVETREFQRMDEQAQGLLADASAAGPDNAEEGG